MLNFNTVLWVDDKRDVLKAVNLVQIALLLNENCGQKAKID